MKTVTDTVSIRAAGQVVWNALIGADTYGKWASAFSPGSRFVGEWRQGATIRFIDPALGGTRAILEEVTPFRKIRARHTAVITADGAEDTESPDARKWIGSLETYVLEEAHGVTTLTVEMQVHEDHLAMFEESWPKALGLLKDLCETANGYRPFDASNP